MKYDFSSFEEEVRKVEDWLIHELASVRTGRATPTLLDGVQVEAYGAKSSISHVAGITTEDARTLRITPWDKSIIKMIETAINVADLGVSVVADGEGLRVVFPELTTERRELLIKTAKDKLERARVSLRAAREDVWSELQDLQRSGELSEDEKFRYKEALEEKTKEASKRLEELFEQKRRQINE